MILTPLKTIEAHQKSGIWGRVTLDALFRKTAMAHPDRLALCDPADRAGWISGAARQMTYGQADEEITRLASFFGAVGLQPDHVIGLQTPNTVDGVIALLAALRAGLVVAPLPLYWRQKNVLEALSRAGAKALIAGESFGGRSLGLEARDAAAEMFSLRFVFGLGRDVPDGVMELGEVLGAGAEDMGDLSGNLPRRGTDAADHVATLTWTQSTSGEPLPIARSHNQWIAAGLMPYLELSLPEAPKFVLPYAVTGMAGIGAGLMPWLLAGGTLHLHQPRSLRRLAAHVDSVGADCVLCPGSLVGSLEKRLDNMECSVVAVWSAHSAAPVPRATNRDLVDLHVVDEFAMIARRREGSALPRPFRSGRIGSPSSAANGPALLEVEVDTEMEGSGGPNTLKVRGAMVADSAWPSSRVRIPTDKAGFVDTLLPVRMSEHGVSGVGIPGTSAPGVFSLPALDALYGAFPGMKEAAAFLVDDGILGARVYAALVPQNGFHLDIEGFFAYLDTERAGLAEIPHRILSLTALPRKENGAVDRAALSERVSLRHAAVA
ncbi:MAG: AMP-binding protein [Phycisphaerales bacterium JB054]